MIQKQKGIFCARLLDSAIDEKLFFQNSTAAQQYDTGGYYDSPFFAITAQTFLHIRAAQTFFFFISDVMGRTLFKSRGWDVKKLQEKYEAAMRTPLQRVST